MLLKGLYPGNVLFVCQTPLHFLLMASLSRLWDGDKVVVWVSESDVDARLVERASCLSGGGMLCLPGGARIQNKPLRILTRVVNVFRLRFFQRDMRGHSLVVFNDLSPETQYLIEAFHSRGGKVYLGEDGVATYPTGSLVPAGRLSRVLGKFLYGVWWSPGLKIGLNEKVSVVFASYPGLIRSDVRHRKDVRSLPLLEPDDLDPSFDLRLQNCLLCVMPLVSSIPDEDLKRFVSALRCVGGQLAIKLHPRESEAGGRRIEYLIKEGRHFYVPKEAPIEAICLKTQGIKAVVGYRSSALHLLKTLRPELKVMYVEFLEGQSGEVWRAFYCGVGVVDFFDVYGFS